MGEEKMVDMLVYPVCHVGGKIRVMLAGLEGRLLCLSPTSCDDVPEGSSWLELAPVDLGDVGNVPEVVCIDSAPKDTDGAEEEFDRTLKAIESWGQQIGMDTGVDTALLALESAATGSEEIQGLVGAIKGGDGKDPLHMARIFLALSQRADAGQDEVDARLFRLQAEAGRLLELVDGKHVIETERGRHEIPSFDLPLFHVEPLTHARTRLRHWAVLLAMGGPWKVPPGTWPLGMSISVKDSMDAAFESLTGRTALDLISIPLVASEASNGVPVLGTEAARLLGHVLDALGGLGLEEMDSAIAAGDVAGLEELHHLVEESERSSSAYARLILTVYPVMGWAKTLAKAAGLEEEAGAALSSHMDVSGSLYLV